MRIHCISDTHNQHDRVIPLKADVIIHSGDFTCGGTDVETVCFLKWFSKVGNYKYRIFIAGNHDRFFETSKTFINTILPTNVIYLENSLVELSGIKIWGTPVSKFWGNWAFNYDDFYLNKFWLKIPKNVDILVTHTSPIGILDNVGNSPNNGSFTLKIEIERRIKPKFNLFGHFHDCYGQCEVNNTRYVNSSIVDGYNNFTDRKGIVVEI